MPARASKEKKRNPSRKNNDKISGSVHGISIIKKKKLNRSKKRNQKNPVYTIKI